MLAVNLRSFRQKVRHNKKELKGFLSRLLKDQPRGMDKLAASLEMDVWKEVDCLTCANCCKTMSPTFTKTDIKRISKHFGQSGQPMPEPVVRTTLPATKISRIKISVIQEKRINALLMIVLI